MLISTKGRYALRVMIDLAEHQTDGYIPLKEVAQRQDISEKYLETIIRLLVKANILSGLRGKGGGYKLTKSPDQYTVGAILRLTEDSLAPVSCLGPGAAVCARAAECRTLHMWQGLDKVINEYLDNVTIADLMKSGAGRISYRLIFPHIAPKISALYRFFATGHRIWKTAWMLLNILFLMPGLLRFNPQSSVLFS